MDFIEELISGTLQKMSTVALKHNWSNRQWTSRVKQAIIDVSEQHCCLTAANGCRSYEGKEWLYDVVWYLQDEADYTIDVPLVAESEWGWKGINDIRGDFENCSCHVQNIESCSLEYQMSPEFTHKWQDGIVDKEVSA